jgi:hypothetical protein
MTSSETPGVQPLIDQIGKIFWTIPTQRTAFDAFVKGSKTAIAPILMRAKRRFRKIKVVSAILVAICVATFVASKPLDRDVVVLMLWTFMLLTLQRFAAMIYSRYRWQELYNAAVLEPPWQRDLLIGEAGLLVRTTTSQTVFFWSDARRMVQSGDDRFICFADGSAVTIHVPQWSVEGHDWNGLLSFLTERIGENRATVSPRS